MPSPSILLLLACNMSENEDWAKATRNGRQLCLCECVTVTPKWIDQIRMALIKKKKRKPIMAWKWNADDHP